MGNLHPYLPGLPWLKPVLEKPRHLLLPPLFAVLLLGSGCTAMVHNLVVDRYPTFAETEAAWGQPAAGEGRVVICYPRLPGAGFSPVGAGGLDSRQVTVDGKIKTTLLDQTFVFIDLPAGSHEVSFKGWLGKKLAASINVNAASTNFVRIVWTQFGKQAPPQLMEARPELRSELETLHHNYKVAVPFNRQPKRSRPAG